MTQSTVPGETSIPGNTSSPARITFYVMPLFYRIAADVLVVFHACFVVFVVAGLLLTFAGGWRGWRWVRNFWFRAAHLACIGVVVAESWFGIICPLTTWEKQLRDLAGETAYRGDFIAHWVGEILFYDLPAWVFTLAYSLFGLAVLATFVFVPPRRPFRRKRNHPA